MTFRCWLALPLLLMVGCEAKSPSATPLYVGQLLSLSGKDQANPLSAADKAYGQATQHGIRLALADLNKEGVRPIKVLHGDTRGRPEAFEAEAVRLVTINRVAALMGGRTTDDAEAMSKAGVPVLSPLGTRSQGMGEGVFTTGLSLEVRAQALARFAVEELQARKLLILLDDSRDDNPKLTEAFTSSFVAAWAKKNSKETVKRPARWLLTKDSKAADLAAKLGKEKGQTVMFAGPTGLLRELRLECQKQGSSTAFLFGGEVVALTDIARSGDVGPPLYYATPFVADADIARIEEFVKKYQETFGGPPDAAAAQAYEDMHLLGEVLQRCGEAPGKIAAELLEVKDFPGLAGALSFAENRQLRRPVFIVGVEGIPGKMLKRYAAE